MSSPPIISPMDVCVSPGDDLSLDEHLNLPIGIGSRWVAPTDRVEYINGVKHVVVGTDLTCDNHRSHSANHLPAEGKTVW